MIILDYAIDDVMEYHFATRDFTISKSLIINKERIVSMLPLLVQFRIFPTDFNITKAEAAGCFFEAINGTKRCAINFKFCSASRKCGYQTISNCSM